MAGTERHAIRYDERTQSWLHITDGRDSSCRHYWCSGWKRDARRKDRHMAKARREEENVD